MPFDFTKLIWASLFGIVIFSEVPTLWTLAGGALIFASASYVTYREGLHRGELAKKQKPAPAESGL